MCGEAAGFGGLGERVDGGFGVAAAADAIFEHTPRPFSPVGWFDLGGGAYHLQAATGSLPMPLP